MSDTSTPDDHAAADPGGDGPGTEPVATTTASSGWRHPGDELEAAAAIVDRMTLADKALLCQGRDHWRTHAIDRVGVPSIMVSDGPHGMRVQPEAGDHLGLNESLEATCFPTASALAATWDPAMVARVGAAIGMEAASQGVDVVLGPGANIKRSPLCGRNFEYFSEDPWLSGAMATTYIRGVQSAGVGTSLKHFVANNQEYRRLTINAVIDERTLREIYLAGFEAAVREGDPWTVMSAYNRVNGSYVGDDEWLLTDVLRDEWGHRGIVMTDWGAMNDRLAAIAAGCELEMPGPVAGAPERIVAAAADGTLDEDVLDRTATRLVALALASAANRRPDAAFDVDEHHALARQAAAGAVVLLVNHSEALPIRASDKVALVGRLAIEPRYQGTGSSQINPTRLDTLRDELEALVGGDRCSFAPGYEGVDVDEDLLDDAVSTVAGADVAVVHVGLPNLMENEGDDRTNLALPASHDALVAAVAAVHDRVVVVLSNGAPVEMPWIDDVDAVVEGYLGGQAGAGGLADVLTGVVAPSGRLAETFPVSLDRVSSTPNFPGGPQVVEYREGIWVGYRHTETADVDVLFPFGHGLTYGHLEVGDARLDRSSISAEELADGATVTVSVTVTNPGDRDLVHVVQVYVHDHHAAVPRPRRELAGFARIEVPAGATVEAAVALGRRAFAWWDVESGDWMVEGGTATIEVGNSARNIVTGADVQIEGPQVEPRDVPVAYARPARHLRVRRTDFAEVLGRVPPANAPFTPPWDHNTPIGAVGDSAQGKAVQAAARRWARREIGDDPTGEALVRALAEEAPLRIFARMGGLSLDQLDGLVGVLNGDWAGGARQVMAEVKALFER